MANELTLSLSLVFEKAGVRLNHQISSLLRTIAGDQSFQNIQAVGTSNEVLNFGDTLPGYVLILNLDDTNYVEIFGDDADAELHDKLLAGDLCVRKLDGATPLYGKANTAGCDCLVIGLDL